MLIVSYCMCHSHIGKLGAEIILLKCLVCVWCWWCILVGTKRWQIVFTIFLRTFQKRKCEFYYIADGNPLIRGKYFINASTRSGGVALLLTLCFTWQVVFMWCVLFLFMFELADGPKTIFPTFWSLNLYSILFRTE